ncbi:DUF4404 domain-containing protein [candidate division KSB1 bacterium]|nr:MAG: DUF4404 domain-containing protein [candidate division KSB1 bacterium]
MQEKFRKSVDKLRDQVNQIDASKKDVKAEMNQLLDDLEHQMQHPEDNDHLEKLNGKLSSLIAKFELEHPGLAETLNELMVILSNMGI